MIDVASRFSALCSEFYQVWLRYHPQRALEAGLEGYEHLLPPVDDDDLGALLAWLESLLGALDEVPEGELGPDDRLDMELLRAGARLEHQVLLQRDWRHRDPIGFLPLRAVNDLLESGAARPPSALPRLLIAIPEYMRHARSQLSTVPELIPVPWLEQAIAEAEAGAAYLRRLPGSLALKSEDDEAPSLQPLVDEAAGALEAYARFLADDVASVAGGELGWGAELFEGVLRLRHGLDITADAAGRVCEAVYRETLSELRTLAESQTGTPDVDGLAGILFSPPLTECALAECYRSELASARDFVVRRNLVSGGEWPPLTPKPVSSLPALSGDPAYRPPRSASAGNEACLRYDPMLGASRFEVRVDCVKAGWPGGHLLASMALSRAASSTPARLFNTSSTLKQGWGLYAQQLMCEQAYLNAPEDRFALLLDRLRHALLGVIDVELHARQGSATAALRRLGEVPGARQDQSWRALLACSRQPGDAAGAILGWVLTNAARGILVPGGADGKLRDFHDRMLRQGPLALPRVVEREFGGEVLRSVLVRGLGATAPLRVQTQ